MTSNIPPDAEIDAPAMIGRGLCVCGRTRRKHSHRDKTANKVFPHASSLLRCVEARDVPDRAGLLFRRHARFHGT